MIESLISFLHALPPWGVLILTFAVAYIENLFPPSPSDVFLVFIGTLVGIGVIDFVSALAAATLGSVTGFYTAYWLGKRYGRSLLESGWLPFVTDHLLNKVDSWFSRYHYWIIIGNRFLAGTRAVISFAAGIARMPVVRTTALCTVSALAWNALLLAAGLYLGAQWKAVEGILSTYGWVVTGILVVLVTVVVLRRRIRTSKPPTSN